jgi:hypothetical protein
LNLRKNIIIQVFGIQSLLENFFTLLQSSSSSLSFLLDVDRYVKTTDGTKFTFKPGDVLFQDNTKNSPANKQPEHYSGVVGDQPCQQMIVQLSRPPQVNEPNPF